MSDWKPFKEIDFSNESLNQFHIDTRDFCCNAFNKEADVTLSNWDSIDANPNAYYHTSEEIFNLINRLYEESGGEGEWRMLTLKKDGIPLVNGWELKYIRIYRFEEGLLVILRTNNQYSEGVIEGIALDKGLLSFPVNNDPNVLNHY